MAENVSDPNATRARARERARTEREQRRQADTNPEWSPSEPAGIPPHIRAQIVAAIAEGRRIREERDALNQRNEGDR